MKKILSILTLLFLLAGSALADKVKVRIFSNYRVETLNVSFDLGNYDLYVGDSLLEANLGEGLSVIFQSTAQGVHVAVNDYEYGVFPKASLRARDTACILCVNPKNVAQRTYEGDLAVSTMNATALLLINEVEFETYIAGVTQSEIYGSQPDIFRVQATISRTWALKNMHKHKKDGYNFCDQVHCQAYLNRCVRPDIMLGTIRSMGETIVDAEGHLIETPFHSNSGGVTANSEDVWRSALPYLRSVPDTFSYRMRQSEWSKVITKEKWLGYFSRTHKLNTADPAVADSLLHFSQDDGRKVKIMGVPLTRVRVDFQLKSTYFSVVPDGSNVIIKGRGYGHGVGLSQEGTIRMVSLGFTPNEIITHYYTGSKIVRDKNVSEKYVRDYVSDMEKIIAEDKAHPGKTKSKKDDWLGQLFRIRDREDREEVYEPAKHEIEKDWQYDW